jgi:hypothetical protein
MYTACSSSGQTKQSRLHIDGVTGKRGMFHEWLKI